jgi:NAD(P)-dependent dehydrogenase (short-subunit alcohol dehydrogenase family)
MTKFAFVTGASSGFGRATVLAFVQAGYQVLAGVRRESDAESLRAASPNIVPVFIDLADDVSVVRAAQEVDTLVGANGLSALVNMAGYAFYSPIEYAPANEVSRLFDVLVFAPSRLTNHLLPALRRYRGGRPKVLNVISWAALDASPFAGHYASAKAAFLRLTQAQLYELDRYGIDVAAVVPGLMRTPFVLRSRQQIAETLARLPVAGVEAYGRDLNHMVALSAAAEHSPMMPAPEAYARRIVRIAGRRHLRQQYKLGVDTMLVSLMNAVLPFWALRRIKMAMFGLGG